MQIRAHFKANSNGEKYNSIETRSSFTWSKCWCLSHPNILLSWRGKRKIKHKSTFFSSNFQIYFKLVLTTKNVPYWNSSLFCVQKMWLNSELTTNWKWSLQSHIIEFIRFLLNHCQWDLKTLLLNVKYMPTKRKRYSNSLSIVCDSHNFFSNITHQ